MPDRLTRHNWTDHLPVPEWHWDEKKNQVPVVKLTYPDGYQPLAIVSPVLTERVGDDEFEVVGLYFEEKKGGSIVFSGIPVSELKSGIVKLKDGLYVKVEFNGTAGDLRHRFRQWSL